MGLVAHPSNQEYNAQALAGQYLSALGWPNTPANRQALAAWFMVESARAGATDIFVKGNNPLNITGCSNYRLVGTHKICVFATQTEGIQAFRNLIHSSGHNYPGIVQQFSAPGGNNGQAVISAIINSGWVPGGTGPSYWHTVNGVRSNLLQSVYNGIIGNSNVPATSPSGSGGAATGQINIDQLATFLGHGPNTLFTAADAAKIRATLLAATNGIPGADVGYDLTIGAVINSWVNGKTTVAQAANNLTNTPGFTWSTLSTTPATGAQATAGAIGGLAAAIAGIGATIANALGKGPFLIALVGAGAMGLFGIYLITKEATAPGQSQGPQSIVSPVPIFIREGA